MDFPSQVGGATQQAAQVQELASGYLKYVHKALAVWNVVAKKAFCAPEANEGHAGRFGSTRLSLNMDLRCQVARCTSTGSGRQQLLLHLLGVLASGQVQRLLKILVINLCGILLQLT
eukprot:3158215-Amphidinium_carterae.1